MVPALLGEFESLNHKHFEGLLIPQVNVDTMDTHAKMILQPGTWDTQMEVLAAATYFQVPLYYIAYQGKVADIKWSVAKPLHYRSKFCFVDINQALPPMNSITHFDLV